MESGKLHVSIGMAILSWFLTGVAWVVSHMAIIAGFAAIIASILSGMAAWETYRLRRSERKRLEALTRRDSK